MSERQSQKYPAQKRVESPQKTVERQPHLRNKENKEGRENVDRRHVEATSDVCNHVKEWWLRTIIFSFIYLRGRSVLFCQIFFFFFFIFLIYQCISVVFSSQIFFVYIVINYLKRRAYYQIDWTQISIELF